MKVHSSIDDDTSDKIKIIATMKGLDNIDYGKCYRLYKVGSKRDEFTIQMLEKRCVGSGEVYLVGNSSLVGIYISGLREWFRTSEVISCKKKEKCVMIETINSFYELVEDE
jgi:hypothetical protein